MKHAVIVLPTYNEKENIKSLIPAIFDQTNQINGWFFSILVVDDSSPDGTYNEIVHLQKKFKDLHVIKGKKQGLGRAYLRGFAHALQHYQPDILFEMDADWSHLPEIIPQFIKEIDKGADFVIGSRYIKGGSIPPEWGLHRKIFSFFGNIIVRLGFMNLQMHEWTNGFRAIKGTFIRNVLSELNSFNGYVFQIAILDRALKNHLKIVEVPMHFKERKNGKSKINAGKYILDIFVYIFLNSSFIKFCFVGFVGFIINIIGLEFFYRIGFLPGIAAGIGAELSIISNFILNNSWSFAHKKIGKEIGTFNKFLQFNFVSFGSVIMQFIV